MNYKLAPGLIALSAVTSVATSIATIPSLFAIAPAAAQVPLSTQCLQTPEMIGPVTLVQIAYQGALVKQGIPGQQGLIAAYNQGTITAPQIVDAAVKACILNAKYNFSTNEGYLSDMKLQLQTMTGR
jgi:hypothetical protein